MPAERSAKRKAGSSGQLSTHVEPCSICGKVVSRPSDLPRHMQKHEPDAKKRACPWEGCDFSTLQQSNLDTHYRRHTQDKSFFCRDDPDCEFQTCDPASLLRHRKRRHQYIPRPSGSRKTNKAPKAPAQRGRKAFVDSSSVASPVSLESSLGSNSSTSTSPSSFTGSLSPSYSPPCESTVSTSSTPETLPPLFNESVPWMNSFNSQNESLLFSDSVPPCSYNYAWDVSPLPELDVLTTDPEMEQFEFQCPYPYQGQEETKAQPKNFLPLQLPNLEQALPGYETTGQLHESYGLDFGFEQHMLQAHPPQANGEAWFGLSANGSPILYHHNLPAEAFQAPVEIDCGTMICSPVRTGGLDLDMETTSNSDLDIVFDSGVPGSTDLVQMNSSSCDFNSASFNPPCPLSKLTDSTVFPDATNSQFHQVTFAPIPTDFNAHIGLQAHANPDFIDLSASSPGYFDRCQLTDMNGEADLCLHQTRANSNLMDLSSSGLNYFDQCQWDFGFISTSGIAEGPPDGGLGNIVTLCS